ncbi:hypothetical protein VQL36_08820 [Chengkuizengella sp. SCS-71B]|uniref:hypothetical protein n=1 Tax=Chengkuizengella sp. SCS-71B TaxID=3115290 RepID=UPI0032C2321E
MLDRTQVSLDSMAQIAVDAATSSPFGVLYNILRNGDLIATINDEMDYVVANEGRHTNFPNFPILDNNPSAGINTYDLVCILSLSGGANVTYVASRSLKATVFEC